MRYIYFFSFSLSSLYERPFIEFQPFKTELSVGRAPPPLHLSGPNKSRFGPRSSDASAGLVSSDYSSSPVAGKIFMVGDGGGIQFEVFIPRIGHYFHLDYKLNKRHLKKKKDNI